MAHSRITATLKSLGLEDKYLQAFIDNDIDDNRIQDCLSDPQKLIHINEIVSVPGQFYKAFNDIKVPLQNRGPNEFPAAKREGFLRLKNTFESSGNRPKCTPVQTNKPTPKPRMVNQVKHEGLNTRGERASHAIAVITSGLQKDFLNSGDNDPLPSEAKVNSLATAHGSIRNINSLPDKIIKFGENNKRNKEKTLAVKIQEIVGAYMENMSNLTQGRIVPKMDIEKLHESERTRALTGFNELDANQELKRDGEQHLIVRIDEEYVRITKNVLQQNALRENNITLQASAYLSQAKISYNQRIKEATKNLTDEENLHISQSEIKKEINEILKQQMEVLAVSSKQQNEFMNDLGCYMEAEFEGTLDVFRLKLLEDECVVRTAFLDVRDYYNDEMGKHFQSKDWFEILELQDLHDKVIDAAIERGRNAVDISGSQEKQLRKMINNLFKKYEERNLLRMPTDSYSIGIDLGTTYSCLGVCIKGKVIIIAENEKSTIPSYVAFNEDQTVDVGEAAKDQIFRRPENVIFDAKRLIGRKFTDSIVQNDMKHWPFGVVNSNNQPKIKIPGHREPYFPEQISAYVIAHMKKMAEDYLNRTVNDAVVTVPAYFNDSQRQATKDAAQIAGLNAKILDEPTAAAISYELHRTDDLKRNVLIFDVGGGTFDVAVLNIAGGQIKVKAKRGDTHLGGEDFDNELVKHIIEVVKVKHNIDLGRDRNSDNPGEKRDASERLHRIRTICEKQKRILSSSSSAVIAIPRIDGTFNLEETITREKFVELNLSRFKQCINITANVISEADLNKSEIDDIVLIGGSTKIPKIRELLTEFFDGKALNKTINPDEAVAYGAAIKAALEYVKSNEINKNISVSDVTPISLGISVDSGDMSVIIPKNTSIPCRIKCDYCTSQDWQVGADIVVYEGEKRLAMFNNQLGSFTIFGIPSAPKGEEGIDIYMTIDREGILQVEAVSCSTGTSESIRIEEHKGRMSTREIQLAKASMTNGNSPFEAQYSILIKERRLMTYKI